MNGKKFPVLSSPVSAICGVLFAVACAFLFNNKFQAFYAAHHFSNTSSGEIGVTLGLTFWVGFVIAGFLTGWK